jgi:hypothetical protein
MAGADFRTVGAILPQVPPPVHRRVEQAPDPLFLPIHEAQELAVVDGLEELGVGRKRFPGVAPLKELRVPTTREEECGPLFQKGEESSARMVLPVVKAAAGPARLSRVRLAQRAGNKCGIRNAECGIGGPS